MGCWSAENATNAYLKTLRMGQKAKEPDTAEFISALAAGNNAQLMVVACANSANSTVLALVAAAHQTGGKVICILAGHQELEFSKQVLGFDACHVEFIIGEPQNLLLNHYSEADFVLIDCNLDNHEGILRAVEESRKQNGAVVVGYNAFSKGSWWSSGSKTQLLPIGEGLLVTRIGANGKNTRRGHLRNSSSGSHWVVKVDKCTGEEHVFRVRIPQEKQIIQA
ncbi:uncharacterized protein [Euphorbia lathyris]|uniref:uncharacterized protein n=1 Tax=Euphorbia lathyris TaxID=212925 RepID=UPI0033140698